MLGTVIRQSKKPCMVIAPSKLHDVGLSPDGRVVVWFEDRALRFRDLKTGEDRTLSRHVLGEKITFSPDGTVVIVETPGNITRYSLLHVRTGEEIITFEADEMVTSNPPIQFHPDGHLLATGMSGHNAIITLFYMPSREKVHELRAESLNHTADMNMAYSAAGTLLALYWSDDYNCTSMHLRNPTTGLAIGQYGLDLDFLHLLSFGDPGYFVFSRGRIPIPQDADEQSSELS